MSVVQSVEVKVEVQIVLELGQAFDLSKIPRLESRVEEDRAFSDVADVDWIVLVLRVSVLLGLFHALQKLSQDLLF